MDIVTPEKRSLMMGGIRGKNTKPEMVVRRALHALGFRFRLHRKDLPGSPDLVLPKHRKVVFVHGCFWHGHECRAGRNRPASQKPYWEAKLERTRQRDVLNIVRLQAQGWSILTIWECELRSADRLAQRLRSFLESD